jgi:hypothetical protein
MKKRDLSKSKLTKIALMGLAAGLIVAGQASADSSQIVGKNSLNQQMARGGCANSCNGNNGCNGNGKCNGKKNNNNRRTNILRNGNNNNNNNNNGNGNNNNNDNNNGNGNGNNNNNDNDKAACGGPGGCGGFSL